jgi:signal transduction histidine kinase
VKRESNESERERLGRVAVAEEVSAALRHELRNRLASVHNAVYFIRRRVEDTEPWLRDSRVPTFFQLIGDQLADVEKLLSERAMFGHLFGGEASPVRVGVAVGEEIGRMSVVPGVSIDLSLEDTREVLAIGPEIGLLVHCLVQNAIEATRPGGKVTVTTRDAVADHVCLRVKDTGPGFELDPAEAMRPMRSTKLGHVGVGLKIARRIAERYEGTLTIGPNDGGACVEVSLPMLGASTRSGTTKAAEHSE